MRAGTLLPKRTGWAGGHLSPAEPYKALHGTRVA